MIDLRILNLARDAIKEIRSMPLSSLIPEESRSSFGLRDVASGSYFVWEGRIWKVRKCCRYIDHRIAETRDDYLWQEILAYCLDDASAGIFVSEPDRQDDPYILDHEISFSDLTDLRGNRIGSKNLENVFRVSKTLVGDKNNFIPVAKDELVCTCLESEIDTPIKVYRFQSLMGKRLMIKESREDSYLRYSLGIYRLICLEDISIISLG